jgi:triacylglycerol lipase
MSSAPARRDDALPAALPRLRHPVVLAHGLLGFARFAVRDLELAYFRGIPQRLRDAGNRVLTPEVPPSGSVARRAEALAAAIRAECGAERVHVVAHSMGGLDARHALTHLGLGAQVVSLTTLATPHRGSPVADRATDLARRAGVADALAKMGFDLGAWGDLRTDACAAFNAATPDVPGVRYASFAGVKSRAAAVAALRWTYDAIHAVEGDNDGLVSVASARWGSPAEVVEADHIDFVGWTPSMSTPLGRPVDVDALWARILAVVAATEV